MKDAINAIIKQYDFNLLYAQALVKDVSAEQMTFVPGAGLLNHPAFTLGHLVTGSAMMAEDLGAPMEMPKGWAELFQRKGPNDQSRPDHDANKYPEKIVLLAELEHQHEKVKSLLMLADDALLSETTKWRFRENMPAMIDVVTFMCINHEAMHLGQLAAWRRAMNLPPALMTL